jgi:hypothetical protein
MRHSTCVIAGAALALTLSAGASAADGQGLSVSKDAASWSNWQGRVAFGAPPSFWRSSLSEPDTSRNPGLSLMGDYYFTRSLLGLGTEGGFRATSGLLVGPRAQLWGGQPGLNAGSAFSVGNRLFGAGSVTPYLRDPSTDTATATYVGVGYTGLSARGGWSFSADLGMIAQGPGSSGRPGHMFGSGQNLDDAVRDLRLAPVVQFGVSYAF